MLFPEEISELDVKIEELLSTTEIKTALICFLRKVEVIKAQINVDVEVNESEKKGENRKYKLFWMTIDQMIDERNKEAEFGNTIYIYIV